jgi:cytochrome b561
MIEMNLQKRYDAIAVVLHWLIGICLLAQITLGLWMISLPKTPPGLRAGWFNVHKSVGITLGVLILFRVLWRFMHKPPALADDLPTWEQWVAKANHFMLYLCMIIMPLSGVLGSSFSKYPIQYFGYKLPKFFEPNEAFKEILSQVHLYTLVIFVALISLHILAVIRHTYFHKNTMIRRMWFQ